MVATMLARRAMMRTLPIGARRAQCLSTSIDLKGIEVKGLGSLEDVERFTFKGKKVVQVEAMGAPPIAHPGLPDLPPKVHVDWDHLMAEVTDDNMKKEIVAIKGMMERKQREIDADREKIVSALEPIDWDAWYAQLDGKLNGRGKHLVDALKEAVDTWKVTADDMTEAQEFFVQHRADVKEMVSGAGWESRCARHLTLGLPCVAQEELISSEKTRLEKEIEVLDAQIAGLKEKIANASNITVAELMEADPEMAMAIEEEIRNDNWK